MSTEINNENKIKNNPATIADTCLLYTSDAADE